MTTPQKLSKASGFFFLLGFIIAKLQHIPYPMVSTVFSLISISLYFTGYSCWFTSSFLDPDTEKTRKSWYDFIKTKEYFMAASLVGIIATGLNVVAVFVPILFPPATFIFFTGNLFWIAGEYHKLKNPPQDNNFSKKQQKAKIDYAITTATMALVTAVTATLTFLFPPFIIPLTLFSVLISIGLGILAFDFFLKMTFADKKQVESKTNSLKITSSLKPSPSPEETPESKPIHTASLFAQQSETINLIVLRKKDEPQRLEGLQDSGEQHRCTL